MTIAPDAIGRLATRSVLALMLLTAPTLAPAQRGGGGGGGGHHGGFGASQHGHPINAWMGSHRPKLR